MKVEFVTHATVRDAVGQKRLERDLPDGATVGDAIEQLTESFDGLSPLVLNGDGELRANVNVLVNDENVRQLDDAATVLAEGDTVVIAPGVAGG